MSINSHGFLGDDSRAAVELAWPPHASAMGRIGRERGWLPRTRESCAVQRGPRGALLIGDPEHAAAKIIFEHQLFGMDRFLLQLTGGAKPHEKVMRAIELFDARVAGVVRAAGQRRSTTSGATGGSAETVLPSG